MSERAVTISEVARQRSAALIRDRTAAFGPGLPVVLTGDWHANWLCDLKTDFNDPDSPVVGTEFVGTSITSTDYAAARPAYGGVVLDERPDERGPAVDALRGAGLLAPLPVDAGAAQAGLLPADRRFGKDGQGGEALHRRRLERNGELAVQPLDHRRRLCCVELYQIGDDE